MIADRVLLIDGEAIVIDKPAGLPVDPPRAGGPSVASLAGALRFGFQRAPVAVHRLDRDTSGCLLLARNPRAQGKLQRAWEAGRVEKRYLAVIDGELPDECGVVDLPLAKVSTALHGWRIVVDAKGKRACTHWQVVRRDGDRTLVALRPETGRTHQLRVHAATGLGAPIVGDGVYGTPGPAMLLHAAALSVPRDGKPAIMAEAPLPASFPAWCR